MASIILPPPSPDPPTTPIKEQEGCIKEIGGQLGAKAGVDTPSIDGAASNGSTRVPMTTEEGTDLTCNTLSDLPITPVKLEGLFKEIGGHHGVEPAAAMSPTEQTAAETSTSPMILERTSTPSDMAPPLSKEHATSATKGTVHSGTTPTTSHKSKEQKAAREKNLCVHPVNFEVANSAKPLQFLKDLLVNITQVDPLASILPQPNASSEMPILQSPSDLPRGMDVKKLLFQYIAGLDTTANAMKGKVWLQCHAKFQTFKKNDKFKRWIAGSTVSPRIQLDRSTLNTVVRVPVGMFLNTVTRFDLVASLEERIQSADSLISKIKGEDAKLPPFQIELKLLHRNKHGSTKFCRMLADKDHVQTLRQAMGELFPRLSGEVCFIPFDVWKSLTSTKKNEYFQAQKLFNDSHNAIRLHGLKDSSCRIMTKTGVSSIRDWVLGLKAMNGQTLFHSAFPSVNGTMELWHNVALEKEVKAWLKGAISDIGSMAVTNKTANCSLMEEIFEDVEKVRQRMERANRGGHLYERCKAYMAFEPLKAMSSKAESVSSRHSRKQNKLKLVYDDAPEESTSSTSTSTPGWKKSQRSRPVRNRKKKKNSCVPTPGLLDSHSSSQQSTKSHSKTKNSAFTANKVQVSTIYEGDDEDEESMDCEGDETVPSNMSTGRTWADVAAANPPNINQPGTSKESTTAPRAVNSLNIRDCPMQTITGSKKGLGRGGGGRCNPVNYPTVGGHPPHPASTQASAKNGLGCGGGISFESEGESTTPPCTGKAAKDVNDEVEANSANVAADDVSAVQLELKELRMQSGEKDLQILALTEAVSSLRGQLASLLILIERQQSASVTATATQATAVRTKRPYIKRRCLIFSSPRSASYSPTSPSSSSPEKKKARSYTSASTESSFNPSDQTDSGDQADSDDGWIDSGDQADSDDEWAQKGFAYADEVPTSSSDSDDFPSPQEQAGAGPVL